MVRAKDSYDGAIPSGNSVAVMNLFRLSKITGSTQWVDLADKALKAFTKQAKTSPTGFHSAAPENQAKSVAKSWPEANISRACASG